MMAKIKVLFLASDPFKQNALALDEEIRAITAKIRAAEYRDTLELVSAWAVRRDDLQQLLLQHQPHVVHFSGHGSRAEQLILKDQNGQPRPVSKPALVGLFKALKDNVRVVVLNACHSKLQAEAIAQVIGCAIGMNTAIGDEAAIIFAAAFYQALAFGRSVQAAFDLGKNALMLEDIPEEETLELFVRDGLDASNISLIAPPPNDVVHPRPVDRLSVVMTLGALDSADFESIVASIPGAFPHVSRHVTIPEKAAELVRWAESPTGPGLDAMQKALDHLREARRG